MLAVASPVGFRGRGVCLKAAGIPPKHHRHNSMAMDFFTVPTLGNRKLSEDSVVKKAPEAKFVSLVKHTYRVLLTRGMKGCYVFFEDPKTRDFFLSRIKNRIKGETAAAGNV